MQNFIRVFVIDQQLPIQIQHEFISKPPCLKKTDNEVPPFSSITINYELRYQHREVTLNPLSIFKSSP